MSDSEHAVYVTTSDIDQDGAVRPWSNVRYVGSLVAAIGDIIERHGIDTGFLAPAATLVAKATVHPSAEPPATRIGPLCPKCRQPGLVREAGCLSSVHCGGQSTTWQT